MKIERLEGLTSVKLAHAAKEILMDKKTDERFTRRDAIKVLGSALLATAAACTPINQVLVPVIEPTKNPGAGLNLDIQPPEKDFFASKELFGNIVSMEDIQASDMQKFEPGINKAIEKAGLDINDPHFEINFFGLKLTDSNGNVKNNIFVLRNFAPGIATATPEPVPTISALYYYVEEADFDFVAPGEGPDRSRGRIFPVVVSQSADKKTYTYTLGISRAEGDYEPTIPLIEQNVATGTVTYIEAFSGSSYIMNHGKIPEGLARSVSYVTNPEPTATSAPTEMPTPTREPIPGIDSFIKTGETRLKFTSIKISDSYYDPVIDEKYEIHQGVNQTFLVVEGSYHGNLLTLFGKGGAFWHNSLLYVEGRDWDHYATYLVGNNPESDTFYLLFFIRKDDPGPYAVHNDVHSWTVDLSQIPQPASSDPKNIQADG